MAAYAALVSVMHIIDNLKHHPRPPISLHTKQAHLLTQKLTFLLEFLEHYNPHLGYAKEADPLESRIADAAYAAEDVIECHIVDHGAKDTLYGALEKVIEEMALIEKEAMETGFQHRLHESTPPPEPLRASPMSRMVGADDVLLRMKDKLTSCCRDLQVIPVVGMGGAGKTTLARNVYRECVIKEHFYICAWATISQEYSIREMLVEVLRHLNQDTGQDLSEDELGEKLHKHLFGRKYLIIMDDMWNIEAWDEVKRFLPDNKNCSRIVVTTRLSNLAYELFKSNSLEMKPLNDDESWELLSETVFGEKDCPLELEEIGKKIGKSCNGLPLAIVVVGGLLAKSQLTREFWEFIEGNLNSIVNLADDERCLKILHMSYKQLPVYLKPCFLYMGVFAEDENVRTFKLIKLWVAEGFVKPISGKSLEEIARVYLKDLISRNLISIAQLGSTRDVKRCKIHDLLRDLCLREARKERFYWVTAGSPRPQGFVNGQRRIVISKEDQRVNALSSISLTRSLIWDHGQLKLPWLRLLRILCSCTFTFTVVEYLENVHQLVNSRFLAISVGHRYKLPCSIWLFWNLQTLIVLNSWDVTAPTDFWYMPHIRHVDFDLLSLPDPPNDQDGIVLQNLQSLGVVKNFKCSKQVVERIPNIKKLRICYEEGVDDGHCLNNFGSLDKLESLSCDFTKGMNPSRGGLIKFPHSLKKLALSISSSEYWDDILDKIGALPLLQKLILNGGCFKEGQWETSEGHFPCLKFLALKWCNSLRVWTIESSHFPCLHHLLLDEVNELEEIPLDFAEVSTLGVIEMDGCSDSAVVSAKRILEEQEELYGEAALRVQVRLSRTNNEAEARSLAGPNFRVMY